MRKTSPRRRKPRKTVSGDTALRPQQVREIRLRIRYYDDPVRYVVYSDIFSKRRWRFFLDVSNDMYRMGGWTGATLFKQKRIARLVAKAYSVQKQRTLRVARVTMGLGKTKAKRSEPAPHGRKKRKRSTSAETTTRWRGLDQTVTKIRQRNAHVPDAAIEAAIDAAVAAVRSRRPAKRRRHR